MSESRHSNQADVIVKGERGTGQCYLSQVASGSLHHAGLGAAVVLAASGDIVVAPAGSLGDEHDQQQTTLSQNRFDVLQTSQNQHTGPGAPFCLKRLATLEHRDDASLIAVGQGTRPQIVVTASMSAIIVWNLTARQQTVLAPHDLLVATDEPMEHAAFTDDDRQAAFSAGPVAEVVNLAQNTSLCLLQGHAETITSLAFCGPDRICTTSLDRSYRIWNTVTGETLYDSGGTTSSPLLACTVSHDHRLLAVGSANGMVYVMNVAAERYQPLAAVNLDLALKSRRQPATRDRQPVGLDGHQPVYISQSEGDDSTFCDEKTGGQQAPTSPRRRQWSAMTAPSRTQALITNTDTLHTDSDQQPKPILALSLLHWHGTVPRQTATGSWATQDNDIATSDYAAPTPTYTLVVALPTSVVHLDIASRSVYDVQSWPSVTVSDVVVCRRLAPASSGKPNSSSQQQILSVLTKPAFEPKLSLYALAVQSGPLTEGSGMFSSETKSAQSDTSVRPSACFSTEGDATKDQPPSVAREPLEENASSSPSCIVEPTLSVLLTRQLLPNSPLKAVLHPKAPSKKHASSSRFRPAKGRGRRDPSKGPVKDQPVTFHRKVRSSGYAQPAKQHKMFSPRVNSPRQSRLRPLSDALRARSGSAGGSGASTGWKKPALAPVESKGSGQRYPMDSPAPSALKASLVVQPSNGAGVLALAMCSQGRSLACALADRTVAMSASSLSSDKLGKSIHTRSQGQTKALCWSTNTDWLLTASEDTVTIWDPSKAEPVLDLNRSEHNFKSSAEASAAVENTSFKDVRAALFYFMDKFVLIAEGPRVSLYKYYLDTTVDELRRYTDNSRYKKVVSLSHPSAHGVTALRAVNSFNSPIVLAATTDRSLNVFDMDAGKLVRSFEDAHLKPAHCIALNTGSSFVTHPPEMYDVLLTSAITDGIALWDLRQERCIMRLDSHVCRSFPVQACFSPCGRFVATGSEDRSAYIYDIRQGMYIERLGRHKDTVADVVFRPQKPMLYTACMDGQVRCFGLDD